MAEPECPQKQPYFVNLEPGKYYWCKCGRSKKQPFCDGSHKGTEFNPVEIVVTEKSSMSLCGCKRTKNAPLCDFTHNKL